MEPQLAGSKRKSTFIIDLILVLLLSYVIGNFVHYIIEPKYHIEQGCIENYKVIINKEGVPHQIVDKFGRGIPCNDLEVKK